MCTLAVFLGASRRRPLVVAANRDEALDRPSQPPLLWRRSLPFVAGRDERAGGTWMGLNAKGLFVGLTNLRPEAPVPPAAVSRGQVVVELLGCSDLRAARALLAAQDPAATGPFLVVCADLEGSGFWAATSTQLRPRSLGPGIHVFGNRLPDEEGGETRLSRPRQALAAAWDEAGAGVPGGGERAADARLLEMLAGALGAHDTGGGPDEGFCVHMAQGYGTVSSTLLVARRPLSAGALLHADGPPCRTPFRDCTSLLAELSAFAD